MWTPLHYPFIGGAPRLQNELEGSHSILNLQVYFNFDGGAKINEGGSPEPQLQVPVALLGGFVYMALRVLIVLQSCISSHVLIVHTRRMY